MFSYGAVVAHVLGFSYSEMMDMDVEEFLIWYEKAKEIVSHDD